VSGILTEQAGAWFYKRNAGAAAFAPAERIATIPSSPDPLRGRQLMDLAGNGRLDLVDLSSATPGFFARTAGGDWEPLTPFASLPEIDFDDPNLRFVD